MAIISILYSGIGTLVNKVNFWKWQWEKMQEDNTDLEIL